MKLRTQITFAINMAFVGFCGYLLSNEINQMKVEEAQVLQIQTQVANQIEDGKQLKCLALNVYHEARNEGEQGQRAVAWATLNRTTDKHYPDNVCDVIYQSIRDKSGAPIKHKCQFSWYCDGKSDDIEDIDSWKEAEYIASDVMSKFGKETDPTGGAVMYHADYVTPDWVDDYKREVEIDTHIFYAEIE